MFSSVGYKIGHIHRNSRYNLRGGSIGCFLQGPFLYKGSFYHLDFQLLSGVEAFGTGTEATSVGFPASRSFSSLTSLRTLATRGGTSIDFFSLFTSWVTAGVGEAESLSWILETPPIYRGKGAAFLGFSSSIILPLPLSISLDLPLSTAWAWSFQGVAPQVLAVGGPGLNRTLVTSLVSLTATCAAGA